jgi:hypothetical protein
VTADDDTAETPAAEDKISDNDLDITTKTADAFDPIVGNYADEGEL